MTKEELTNTIRFLHDEVYKQGRRESKANVLRQVSERIEEKCHVIVDVEQCTTYYGLSVKEIKKILEEVERSED